jgi:glycerophosphoryl diester phosphodiesterase
MVIKMGHRGAKGYAPENTIESFKKAIDLGVDYIELDVHLTKDHHLVVHHDYKFGRTAFGCGKIRKMTVDEINQVRIKENDEPIPHLSEVLDRFRGQVKFNIEVKSKRGVEKLCRLIKSRKMQKEVMVSSNHVGVLLRIKKKMPEIETGLLHRAVSNKFLAAVFAFFSVLFFPFHRHVILYQAKRCKADCVHPAYHIATKRFVRKMQDRGYKVNVWGARSRYVLKLLKKRKVDGIITDYPDRI